MSLGKAIRIARIHKGMKQKDLIDATGLSPGRVSAIERDTLDPPFSVMQMIAKILGLSLDALPPVSQASNISKRGRWVKRASVANKAAARPH